MDESSGAAEWSDDVTVEDMEGEMMRELSAEPSPVKLFHDSEEAMGSYSPERVVEEHTIEIEIGATHDAATSRRESEAASGDASSADGRKPQQSEKQSGEGDGFGGADLVEEGAQRTSRWIFLVAFFVVIASVLGTGILALPVRLAPSGFTPFVASYTLGLVMQLLVLVYMCELLQRSDKAWTAMCARSGLVRLGISEMM